MVDETIAYLASQDKFWTMCHDVTGKLSRPPIVNFFGGPKNDLWHVY